MVYSHSSLHFKPQGRYEGGEQVLLSLFSLSWSSFSVYSSIFFFILPNAAPLGLPPGLSPTPRIGH